MIEHVCLESMNVITQLRDIAMHIIETRLHRSKRGSSQCKLCSLSQGNLSVVIIKSLDVYCVMLWMPAQSSLNFNFTEFRDLLLASHNFHACWA